MKRKLNLLLAALVFALVFATNVQPTYAAEVDATETLKLDETADATYHVTIVFNRNGGQGSMSSLSVESGKTTTLLANTFKRSGFQFAGWSTRSDGKGTTYADAADVTELATDDNDGNQITLYAQWKLTTPKIKKVKSTTPSYIQVAFGKCESISGYEIQYSLSKTFSAKKTKTVKVAKSATSAKLLEVTPNKKYYVRMRSYKKKGGVTQYSDWSSPASVKVKNGKTIANTSCDTAIEADVKLTGSGTGYHAKFVMGNEKSAVSFGIQFDRYAEAPYTGKAMALIENISSNSAGGQSYTRPRNKVLRVNKTYHLMMTTDGKGHGDVYVDYKKIGSFYQPELKYLNNVRIESCGRLNGDKVDAEFSNIKYKITRKSDLRVLGDDLKWKELKMNRGLKYKYNKTDNKIRMYGTIKGIHGDWDSDYEAVSEILQFDY